MSKRNDNYTSPYWDTVNGVCTKHLLPQVPCPACLNNKDEDMEIEFDRYQEMGMEVK